VPPAVKEMFPFVKSMVTPPLGTLLAVKLALNQRKDPAGTGVPLKFEALFAVSVHGGGGGGPGQVMLVGEKLMEIVFQPSKVAVPDGVNVPLNVPTDPAMGPLSKVEEVAVNVIELVMGDDPRPEIVQSILYVVPATRSEAASVKVKLPLHA
jgi:hypothetical protein